MNPLKKYHSVWLPPASRRTWLEIVRELADKAKLIIINATKEGKEGDGLCLELRCIPRTFPNKTWLIAGVKGKNQNFICPQIAEAAAALADCPEHVSKAQIVDDVAQNGWPSCPDWVGNISADANRSRHG